LIIFFKTFDPWKRGFISGDGLINKGCLQPSKAPVADMSVTVDNTKSFQQMVGFGAAMTGSSAWLISRHPKKDEIMQKLFGAIEDGGFGISMLRSVISFRVESRVCEPTTHQSIFTAAKLFVHLAIFRQN